MDIWSILKITKPEDKSDKNAIRDAYMTQLAHCNPEDNPQGFQVLREAYETATKLAEETLLQKEKPPDTSPEGLFMMRVKEVYDNFFRRINIEEWRDLLREDVVIQLDTEDEISERLLLFLMDNHYLPQNVWQLLNNHFGWLEKSKELEQTFPSDYLGYIKNQVRFENLRYQLFEYDENISNADYEKIIKQWHSIRRSLDSAEYTGLDELFKELALINHPDFSLAKAELLRQQEKYDDAQTIVLPLVNAYPEHAGTVLEYATLLYYEAIPTHDCSVCESPCENKKENQNENENESENKNEETSYDIDTNKLEVALSQYKKVLEIEPEYFSAKRGVSDCLIALERFEDAREVLYALLVEYPHSMYAMSGFGHVNLKLKEIYTEKHEKDPTDVEVLINLVKFNLSLGDEDLEEAYKLLIKNPELINTHKRYSAFMGECLMHHSQYDEAIVHFKDALVREEYYRSYSRLAAALIQNDNYEDALHYVKIGMTLPDCFENDKSNKARLYIYMGNVYTHKGYFDEALEAYAKAEEIQPLLSRLHYDKAITFKKLHRYAEAVDSCEYSLQLIPYDPDPYCLAMEMYYDANRYDDVLSWAERAENLEVEHSKITYYKACSLRLLNRESEALPLLLSLENIEYQKHDISKGLVLSEIAFIYWGSGFKHFKLTLDYIKRAIEYDSNEEYPYWRFLYMDASIAIQTYQMKAKLHNIDVTKSKDSNIHKDVLTSTTLALSVYDKRVKKTSDWKRPSKIYILLKRGFANFELGNFKNASYDLREVLKHENELKEFDTCLSEIFWRLGYVNEYFKQAEPALKFYKAALNIAPKCRHALLGIAEVTLYLKNNYESALKMYTKFIDSLSNLGVDELSSRAVLGRAFCLKQLKKWFAYRKCYKEAIKTLKLIQHARDDVWIYVHLAVAYRGLNNYKQALKYVTMAETLAKEKGETHTFGCDMSWT